MASWGFVGWKSPGRGAWLEGGGRKELGPGGGRGGAEGPVEDSPWLNWMAVCSTEKRGVKNPHCCVVLIKITRRVGDSRIHEVHLAFTCQHALLLTV